MECKRKMVCCTVYYLFIFSAPANVMCGGSVHEEPIGPEAKVMDKIFRGYNRNARPVENVNDTIELDTLFVLASIDNLDEKTQTLSTYGTISLIGPFQSWKDEFLSWNPDWYNGTKELVVESELVWLPEIIIYNSADVGVDLGTDTSFRVSISYKGDILWNVYYKFLTRCNVDLLRFPFDTQDCYIEFISVLHGDTHLRFSQKVKFVSVQPKVNLMLYNKNPGWNLIHNEATNGTRGGSNGIYPTYSVTLVIRRDPSYFITNIIVPSMFLSYLSIFVFLLPSEEGEKISLQVTVVLSYLMLLLFVADVTPAAGKQLPLMAHYLIGCQCLAIVCLLSTILIINIYNRGNVHRVPSYLRVFIYALSKLVCKTKKISKSSLVSVQKISAQVPVELQNNSETKHDKEQSIQFDKAKKEQFQGDLEKRGNQEDMNEWQIIAGVLDKFFFYVFFVITSFANVALLFVITQE